MRWHQKIKLEEFSSLNIERLQSFDEFDDGDESLVAQLIDIYLEITPKEIDQLKKAVASKESEKARKLAHGLKSSSANLGAENLTNVLQTVEDQHGSDASLFETVLIEYQKVCDELKRIRSRL